MNVPPLIGAIISARLATILELSTVMGSEDVHDLIEIISIDGYNRRLIAKSRED